MTRIAARKHFIDLFMSLGEVPQNPAYHPEGDVLTHTALVTYHAMGKNSWRALAHAALFHDVGKLTATVVHDDGHITAHGHEHESVVILERLKDMGLSMPHYEVVKWVVSNHMKRLEEMRPAKLQRLKEEGMALMAQEKGHDDHGLPKTKSAWATLEHLRFSDAIGRGKNVPVGNGMKGLEQLGTFNIPKDQWTTIRENFIKRLPLISQSLFPIFTRHT